MGSAQSFAGTGAWKGDGRPGISIFTASQSAIFTASQSAIFTVSQSASSGDRNTGEPGQPA